MTQKKFATDKVGHILQKAESWEKPVTQPCREKGIEKNTFCAWRAK